MGKCVSVSVGVAYTGEFRQGSREGGSDPSSHIAWAAREISKIAGPACPFSVPWSGRKPEDDHMLGSLKMNRAKLKMSKNLGF